jgi:hypothetical protein
VYDQLICTLDATPPANSRMFGELIDCNPYPLSNSNRNSRIVPRDMILNIL